MGKSVPNFGSIHAANAMGYKWAPEYNLFVRITPAGNFFKVEIQPRTFHADKANPLTGGKYPSQPWHAQEGILAYAAVLNKYQGRTVSHMFYMDEDGAELPSPVEAETKKEESPAATIKGPIPLGSGASQPPVAKS